MTAKPTLSQFAPILVLALSVAACEPTPVEDMAPAPGPPQTADQPATPRAPAVRAPDPSPAAPPASSAPTPPPAPKPQQPVTSTPRAPTPARWTISRTGQGAVATLSASSGVLLRISCLASPPRLRVNVPTFTPVASEDRLSIGIGSDPIALAANLRARGEGVTARGPLPADISARILRARSISVNYGRQNAGPFETLRGQDAMTFANACAEAAAPPAAPRPDPAKSDGVAQQIPANFRGEWNIRLQDCATGRNDSRLTITAKTVRFYESSGEVTGVTRHGPRSITVDAHYRGEGETWDRGTRMTLSPDEDQLTLEGVTRRRCPVGGGG